MTRHIGLGETVPAHAGHYRKQPKISKWNDGDVKSRRKKHRSRILAIDSVVVATLLAITSVVAAKEPPTRPPAEKTDPNGQNPMLIMVLIRTSSSGEIKKLRAMHIDIVRIRSDPERQTDKHSFDSGWIIEAVIPRHLLPKLKAKGFEVSEVPQKK